MNKYEVARFHHFDGVNHADETHDAGYYLGSSLMAKKRVVIQERPDASSKVIKLIEPGGYVGTVFSYAVDKVGLVWWQLMDKNGNGGNTWVLHQPGYFDKTTAQATSSGKEIDDTKKALDDNNLANVIETSGTKVVKGAGDLVSGAGSALSAIGDNLKWIIVAAVLVAIIFLGFEFGLFRKS